MNPNIPARPTRFDLDVIKAAVQPIEEQLWKWLQYGEDDTPEKQEVLEEIYDVVGNYDYDGFYMAMALKESRYSWGVNRELMDILDAISSYKPEQAAINRWVEAHGIRPTLKVGDTVVTSHLAFRDRVGTIVKIDEDHAIYYVHFPGQPETTRHLFGYEKVSLSDDPDAPSFSIFQTPLELQP